MKNKKYNIYLSFLIIGLVLLTTACGKKGKLHSNEEMLMYIDTLSCNQSNNLENENNSNITCNLKNNYSVISEENYEDNLGEAKKIKLRLNDYDLEFNVISSYQCTSSIDGNCFENTYKITTDYKALANKYFEEKYSKLNVSNICNSTDFPFCSINNQNEIILASKYINSYVDYINGLNIKYLSFESAIDVEFPNKNYSFSVNISLVNEKYVLKTSGSKDNKAIIDLNEYILNYVKENKIF